MDTDAKPLRLLVDAETNGLLDKADLRVHCLVIKNKDTKEVRRYTPDTKEKGLRYLMEADVVYGHNIISFDLAVFKRLYSWFKLKPTVRILDTLVWSRLVFGNLADLDFAALAKGRFTKEEFVVWDSFNRKYKSAVGSHSLAAWGIRLGNNKGDYGKQEDAWDVYTDEMLEYCAQDLEVTDSLITKLESKGFPDDCIDLEMAGAEIIFRQEQHGWYFGVSKAQDLYAKLCGIRSELETKLAEVFPGWWEDMRTPEYYELEYQGHKFRHESKGALENTAWGELNFGRKQKVTRAQVKQMITEGPLRRKHTAFNPGSRMHIARALKEMYGWVPKEFTETGEAKVDETVLELLEYPEAKLLSEYFMVQKRIGQIAEGEQNWLAAEKNGRIHGRCNTLGAVTGRATHAHPNLAQVPSGKKPYGHECRQLFTVPRGYLMVGSDAEGQELRCLAHYLYPYDGGDFARAVVLGNKDEGTDVHTLNMRAAGLQTRDQAKTFNINGCL